MKATQRDFASVAPRAAQQCSIFFFCGPDEAGASAAAKKVASLIPEAGERVELAGADLRQTRHDPALYLETSVTYWCRHAAMKPMMH